MGFVGLLKFALLCIDFLAWPVIALGYPLFASIRAIETGSQHHMRKLVIYWTLFALISLFDFAFLKIFEWIPFWSSIKLIATLWLAMPQFDGACHAYQSLIRPYLVVNVQAVINRFCKRKEEKPHKKETFLDVAEKYIKENGSEALEKLIASKSECNEPDNSQRDTQFVETDEKNAAATLKQLKEADTAQKDNEILEGTEKSEATVAKQLQHSQSITVAWVPKQADAAARVKEMSPPETSAKKRHPETPPMKDNEILETTEKCAEIEAKQHPQSNIVAWVPKQINAAAKVKEMTTAEANVKNRLPETPPMKDDEILGATEKSAAIHAKRVQSAQSNAVVWVLKQKDAAAKVKEMTLAEAGAKNRHPETIPLKDNEILGASDKSAAIEAKQVQHPQSFSVAWVSKQTDAAAKVKERTPPEANAKNRHMKTPPLKDNEILEVTAKSAAADAKHVQHTQSNTVAWVPKQTDAAAKVKQMIPPEASATNRHPETPSPKKVRQEWTCALCQVTTSGSSPLETSKSNQGNREAEEVKEMTPPEASAKNRETSPLKKVQREWTCALCQVTITSEETVDACFKGNKHESKCESLKTRNNTGLSPLATGKSNQASLEAVKNKVGEGPQQKSSQNTEERVQVQVPSDQQKQGRPKQDGAAAQPFKLWCKVCNVKLHSDIDLASHLKGKRHSANMENMMKLGTLESVVS